MKRRFQMQRVILKCDGCGYEAEEDEFEGHLYLFTELNGQEVILNVKGYLPKEAEDGPKVTVYINGDPVSKSELDMSTHLCRECLEKALAKVKVDLTA
jgi:hypothetical protein